MKLLIMAVNFVGKRLFNPPAAAGGAEESQGIGVDRVTSPATPIEAYHVGQIEIRPGVWAFDDGVPLAFLLPHLERRK